MDFRQIFWTGTPSTTGPSFPLPLQLILIFVFCLAIYSVLRLAGQPQRLKRLISGLSIALLLEQFLINLWYWTGPFLAEPLPLYHCRLAKLVYLIYFILPSEYKERIWARTGLYYACTVGFAGALSAFFKPTPDPFHFPHVAIFSYFIGHLLLGLLPLAYLLLDRERPGLAYFWRVQGLILAFNIFIIGANHVLHTNYAFFRKSPIMPDYFLHWPRLLYLVMLCAVYALLCLLSSLILKGLVLGARKLRIRREAKVQHSSL